MESMLGLLRSLSGPGVVAQRTKSVLAERERAEDPRHGKGSVPSARDVHFLLTGVGGLLAFLWEEQAPKRLLTADETGQVSALVQGG
jgi:hypothetical protein